jgi:hypothetical protein
MYLSNKYIVNKTELQIHEPGARADFFSVRVSLLSLCGADKYRLA